MTGLKAGTRYLVVAVAAVALTGCVPADQQPQTPMTAASTAASTAAPTAAPTSAARQSTASASATGHASKPSIKTLQAALVVYFEDQQDLSPVKAQRAATCAVYPSFQELSGHSLRALVQHDPAGIDAGDKKVFGDVTTECITAAG